MEQTKIVNRKIWVTIVAVWLVVAMMTVVVHAANSGNGSGTLAGGLFEYSYTWQATSTDEDYGSKGVSGSATPNANNANKLDLSVSGYKESGCDGAGSDLTVTVTNKSGKLMKVSFNCENDYAVVTAGGETQSENQQFVLQAGEQFTITLHVDKPSSGLVTKEDSITFTTEIPKSVITAVPSPYCDYTVNGVAVEMNASERYVFQTEQGTTINLAATLPEGYTFLGWRISGADDLITDASTSFVSALETTVYPVFEVAERVDEQNFKVDDQYFAYWEEAMAYADSSKSTSKVVAVNKENYELPNNLAANGLAGVGGVYVVGSATGIEYIVPKGVTLLIPNDDANTVYTTLPGSSDSYAAAPKIHRTLTMASGASITVNGAISVAGMQCSNHNVYPPGTACGPLGYIHMQEGSNITINSGANLYAWVISSAPVRWMFMVPFTRICRSLTGAAVMVPARQMATTTESCLSVCSISKMFRYL